MMHAAAQRLQWVKQIGERKANIAGRGEDLTTRPWSLIDHAARIKLLSVSPRPHGLTPVVQTQPLDQESRFGGGCLGFEVQQELLRHDRFILPTGRDSGKIEELPNVAMTEYLTPAIIFVNKHRLLAERGG